MTLSSEYLFSSKKNSVKVNTDPSLALGTIGKSINTLDYSEDLDTVRNLEIGLLSRFLAVNKNNIIMLNQVHGDTILEFDSPIAGDRIFSDADGMITRTGKLCLVIRTADCVPVFAFDVKQKVLGAAHSGWKGCSLNISRKLIRNMKSGFKSDNKYLHIYILPSIGPESYTVNMDVGSLFKDDITVSKDKIYLNLWNNIVKSLIEEGIPEANMHLSGLCSFINSSDYFSYRKGDIGRNLNFAMITG
jgi:polyphenol oxidase